MTIHSHSESWMEEDRSSEQTMFRAERVLSLVELPCHPQGQSLGEVANVDLSPTGIVLRAKTKKDMYQ